MNILLLIGGLILILLGANGLTNGAASVAKRFHIPPIVIGLTIVAFGTSAPELTVSVSSALKGSAAGTHYLVLGDVLVYYVTKSLCAGFRSKGQTAFSYGLYFLQKFFTEIVYSQRRQ